MSEMASEKKEKLEAQIKSADMSEDMQQEAIDVATEAMDKFPIEKREIKDS
ncbi:Dynein light chain [Ascosphaera aggregata]|nr:Dynein light chain [Ascosphaera aggregata]